MLRPLNRREQYLMDLICDGEVQKKAADKLRICRGTVAIYMMRIKVKLGAKTTAQACVIYDRVYRTASRPAT